MKKNAYGTYDGTLKWIKMSNNNWYRFEQCPECLEIKPIERRAMYCSVECRQKARKGTIRITDPKGTYFYQMMHTRINKLRGKASKCILGCKSTRYHWANLTGDFADMDDYIEMCSSCHRRFDKRRVAVIK